jgi:hypothetical protein
MSANHQIVRLGMELALAVNDYNSRITDNLTEVSKLTLAYLAAVNVALEEGRIQEEEVPEYFSLVGQSWGSIQARFENEYIPESSGSKNETPGKG